MTLTFAQLKDANARRVGLFKNARGEVAHPGGITHWSIDQWTNALCGEAGEAANFAKKFARGDYPPGPAGDAAFHDAIAAELADVVCYADLCAQRLGIDLGEAVTKKFNQVSTKIGVPIYLNRAPEISRQRPGSCDKPRIYRPVEDDESPD